MAGYVLIDVAITDPDAFAEVRDEAAAVVAARGGKYLIRGGATNVVQGDRTPNRLILLEFESVAQAEAWWNSPDHRELRAKLDRCSRATTVIAEGV